MRRLGIGIAAAASLVGHPAFSDPPVVAKAFTGLIGNMPFQFRIYLDAREASISGCFEDGTFSVQTHHFFGPMAVKPAGDGHFAVQADISDQNTSKRGHIEFNMAFKISPQGKKYPYIVGDLRLDGDETQSFVAKTAVDTNADVLEPPPSLIAEDNEKDIYPDAIGVYFDRSNIYAVNSVLEKDGLEPIIDSCNEYYIGSHMIRGDVKVSSFDRLNEINRLRATGLFEKVGPDHVEEGSDTVDIFYPASAFDATNASTFQASMKALADGIVDRDFKGAGMTEPLLTGNPNKFVYVIEGRSQALALGEANHWEKYKVQLLFYAAPDPTAKKIGLEISIVDGEIAAYREDERPPEGRYEQMSNYMLTTLAAKVGARAALRTGATAGAVGPLYPYVLTAQSLKE